MTPSQKIRNFIAAKAGDQSNTIRPPETVQIGADLALAHARPRTHVPARKPAPTNAAQELGSEEPKRIAAELMRLHRDGAIRSQHNAGGNGPGPYVPTKQQRVRILPGLTHEQRRRHLQEDLDRALEYKPSTE
jgi:hypothetical protein